MALKMSSRDAITASMAECFITLDGKRYNFMQCINLEAEIEKQKTEVPILGQIMKGNKTTGMTGSGSATFHYNTSIFREIIYNLKETGEDLYFDIQLTNEDPGSTVGRQTVILKDCNLDGIMLAKFDADEEILEDEFEFTFDDFEIPEKFSILKGMV